MRARGFFVTGTDTGVGKTLVSAALLRRCVGQGLRAVGMKPVAAGCAMGEGGWTNEDVEALRAASNVDVPIAQINPYAFTPPVAPHIAAQQAGLPIDLAHIRACYDMLAGQADVVVVEGAGGLLVPLNESQTMADLASTLQLPVILVVGMRLGCLNHALLTAEVLAHRGLNLAGWVANRIDPDMSRFEENFSALERRIPAPRLGVIPFLSTPQNPLSVEGLIAVPA